MGSVHQPDINGPIVYWCAQNKCRACLDRLLVHHERLVHAVVRRQYLGGMAYRDAVQEGRVALWRAILTFDPTRGNAFSTYAWVVIRNQVRRAVNKHRRPVGYLVLAEVPDPLERAELGVVLDAALAQLPPRLQFVLSEAYGLAGSPPRTYADIGRELGVSRERVRFCHSQALTKLRTPVLCLPLRAVWEDNGRASYQRVTALLRVWQRQRRAQYRSRLRARQRRGEP